MKKIKVLLFLLLTYSSYSFSQKKEFATVIIKVYYQTNLIEYDNKGASKSPIIYMPNNIVGLFEDSSDPKNKKKIETLNQAINYIHKFRWELKTSNVLPYSGGMGNNSTSILINTNKYTQVLIFERDNISIE
jgi:hypothetical protein